MERFNIETGRMKGAPECMRISGFMHGINNPELTKRLNEHVPKKMEEMMIATTAFIRGEAATASKKKGHMFWKQQDHSKKHTDKRPDFRGHSKDVRAGKLSHLIKEMKQGREQPKTGRKEVAAKDKPTMIYMVRSWQRTVKQKITQSFEQGKEITFPPLTTNNRTEGPLVIEAEMGGHTIHRMYIDGGSSMKILYEHCFNRLRPKIKSQMVPATTSLTGFSGETTWPLGQLNLLMTIGDATHSTKAWMNFMVVKSLSPYNGIIGRPGLKAIQAVPSTVHGMLKFPIKGGDHIFAWQPSDMIGVPRSIAEHRLNIREGCPPVRHKKRGQAPERTKAIKAEVQKLVEARIIREVYYHDWLSNPVMVESLCGYPFKCFLDAYKGYHQIQMAAADEEKTAFHTGQGVYCYTKMPFGLKNDGVTYQRLMDKAFESQMGRNIEVYVDDWVIKSHTKAKMVRDIEETFQTLRKINMKLNLKKCSFGLAEGVFLGRDDRTGDGPDASLLHKPCVTGSGTKLLTDRKTGFITSLCSKTNLKIFSGTSYHGDHNITYRPRTSIKGQVLADFLNEIPSNASQGVSVAETQKEPWSLFIDSSSCVDGSGAGLILTNPDGVEFTYALRFQFAASNNEAEYKALIAGLRIATQIGVKNIQENVDSKLVLVEELETKSITGKEVTAVIEEEGPTWMTELVNYLKEGILPGDEKEPRKILLKARQHPQQPLTPITAPWPFYKWGIDIAGPFPEGLRKVKFLIVAMDYFMKWIEAKAVATITGGQFADNPFKDWCDKLNITQRFALVKHPQSNRLVDRANRSLGEGIKGRLGEGNKNWVEELPHVLWAHRTMIKSSHGDTPFSLTYGTEAVIPAEIEMPTYRTTVVDVVNNDEELRLNLDLLEERRELVAMSEAKSKSKMMKYYNSRVRGVAFKPGDSVYRSNDASHVVAGGKLGPKWEGPYEVTNVLGNGAYKLRSTDGTMLPRTWNVTNLKRCYLQAHARTPAMVKIRK
nr:reverse transcriptase domain-containing protein [Tanacetum cinerariifolium]